MIQGINRHTIQLRKLIVLYNQARVRKNNDIYQQPHVLVRYSESYSTKNQNIHASGTCSMQENKIRHDK